MLKSKNCKEFFCNRSAKHCTRRRRERRAQARHRAVGWQLHQESLESDRPVGEQMLLQFHRKVTSLVRSVSGLDDTLKAMQIVQAAETSQAEGRRVGVV